MCYFLGTLGGMIGLRKRTHPLNHEPNKAGGCHILLILTHALALLISASKLNGHPIHLVAGCIQAREGLVSFYRIRDISSVAGWTKVPSWPQTKFNKAFCIKKKALPSAANPSGEPSPNITINLICSYILRQMSGHFNGGWQFSSHY